jgi:hypothetical protein
MSGGHFDYKQYKIGEIAAGIEYVLKENTYSDEVEAILKRGVHALKVAEIYADRIDCFLSGDDGENDLFRRLHDDLIKLR